MEIFTADLLIPLAGLCVSFTYKPPAQPTATTLELWCWMEPSNSAADATADATADASADATAATAHAIGATVSQGTVTADVDAAKQ